MLRRRRALLDVLFVCFCTTTTMCGLLMVRVVQSFSIERKDLAGIWKLQLDDPSSAINDNNNGKSIMLKLQEDGSFQQCNDDDESNNNGGLRGCWNLDGDSELQLAVDRQRPASSSSSRDVLLSGKVVAGGGSSDNHDGDDCSLAVQRGLVSAGKFMHPTTHAAFFDHVMAASELAGTFQLKQVAGFHRILSSMMMAAAATASATADVDGDNIHGETASSSAPPKIVAASQFFNRSFFMTVVPIESKIKPADLWDKAKREWSSNNWDDRQQAIDIRTMPITFFPNATFEAIGVNKILRGRFEVTQQQEDNDNNNNDNSHSELVFRVSRFGMGRSTPGSVYSEGIGLSHEDERTYIGSIKVEEEQHHPGDGGGRNNTSSLRRLLRVEGKVTYGNDLGSDARPEPVGEFIMREVEDASLEMIVDDDDRDDKNASDNSEDDIFDSVFE